MLIDGSGQFLVFSLLPLSTILILFIYFIPPFNIFRLLLLSFILSIFSFVWFHCCPPVGPYQDYFFPSFAFRPLFLFARYLYSILFYFNTFYFYCPSFNLFHFIILIRPFLSSCSILYFLSFHISRCPSSLRSCCLSHPWKLFTLNWIGSWEKYKLTI